MKKEETIEFVTINEMLEYAIKLFPNFLMYTSKDSKDQYGQRHRESMKQEIKRTLLEHKLISKSKSKSTKAHTVSKEIAEFFIEHIMHSYFEKKLEELENPQNQKMREDLQKIDKQRSEEQQTLFEIGSQEQIQQSFGNDVDMIDELIKSHPEEAENYINLEYNGVNNWIHKRNFSYHIPDKTWHAEYEGDIAGLPVDFADQIIEKMMLRALFDKFYEFDEKNFRKDIMLRAIFTSPEDPVQFEPGHEELTEKLEKPIGHYVFPKEQTKGKQTKDDIKRIYMDVIDKIITILEKHEIITGYKLSEKEIENFRKYTQKYVIDNLEKLSNDTYYNSMRDLFEKYK